jgi:membrane protease YdiL (CAAX protease family)
VPLDHNTLPDTPIGNLSNNQSDIETSKFKPVAFAFVSLGIIFFLYQFIAGGISIILFGAVPASSKTAFFRITMAVAEFIFILIPTLLLAKFQVRNWKHLLRFRKPDLSSILLAIIGVISLQQLLEIYLYLQGLIPLPQQMKQIVDQLQKAIEQTYKVLITAHSLSEFLIVLLVVAVTPAICEEILFRGLVQGNLEMKLSKPAAIILTGTIFGFYHLDPLTLVPLCILGIYLSYLASATGSILVPITAHFANNFVSAFVYYNFSKESLLTPPKGMKMGVGYIVEWSILLATIFAITIILTHRYCQRLPENKNLRNH